MDALIVTTIVCATVIYLLERVLPLLWEVWGSDPQQQERTPPPQFEPITPAPFTIEPMPSDLVEIAQTESEGWAKESTLKAMFETYEQTRDWDVVRRMWRPGNGPIS